MLLERNVVGNQEDWAQYVTLADEHAHPILAALPTGGKPVNVLYNYQADAYAEPQPNAWPDGKDWTEFKSAGANRKELQARVQWFVNTASVSKLAQDVTDVAGIADELANEIPKKLFEMSREMECTFAGVQEAYEDDGVTGNKTRSIANWVQNGAQTIYPVDSTFRTPTASIYSDVKANLNENALRAVLQSQWEATGSKSTKIGFVGPELKERISDFVLYVPSSLSTQNTARVSNRQLESGQLKFMVDVYASDFGQVELRLTNWNAHANFGGSSGKNDWYGYILNKERWELRWNQKPKVYRPEFKGGSYKAAMDTIAMLVCRNPLGEAKIAPSDA